MQMKHNVHTEQHLITPLHQQLKCKHTLATLLDSSTIIIQKLNVLKMCLMYSSNLNCTLSSTGALRVLLCWCDAVCAGNNTGGLEHQAEMSW